MLCIFAWTPELFPSIFRISGEKRTKSTKKNDTFATSWPNLISNQNSQFPLWKLENSWEWRNYLFLAKWRQHVHSPWWPPLGPVPFTGLYRPHAGGKSMLSQLSPKFVANFIANCFWDNFIKGNNAKKNWVKIQTGLLISWL